MFKNKRIEMQQRTIRNLQKDNKMLLNEILELRDKLENQQYIIKEALLYKEQYDKTLSSLNNLRGKYENVLIKLNIEKRKYKTAMKDYMKNNL